MQTVCIITVWILETYLTLFQQEQLEHWVQIDEVQASTENRMKQKIYRYWCCRIWTLIPSALWLMKDPIFQLQDQIKLLLCLNKCEAVNHIFLWIEKIMTHFFQTWSKNMNSIGKEKIRKSIKKMQDKKIKNKKISALRLLKDTFLRTFS